MTSHPGPMSPEFVTIIQRLADQATTALLLFLAVYWLARILKAQYDSRIANLEKRSDICESDRKELSRRVHDIQQERIGLLERLLKEKEE